MIGKSALVFFTAWHYGRLDYLFIIIREISARMKRFSSLLI